MTRSDIAGKSWTAANVLMALMFAFSVVVQMNDPDPVLWMAMYAAATAVAVLEVRRKAPWWAACGVGIIALIWAGTIAPRVLGVVPFASMFEEFEMKNLAVEESREMYGLLIVAIWMLAIEWAGMRRRRALGATVFAQK
jgi:hypothetical protein